MIVMLGAAVNPRDEHRHAALILRLKAKVLDSRLTAVASPCVGHGGRTAGFVPDDDQDDDELEAKVAALRLAIKMLH